MSDWDTVTVLRKRAPKASAMKSETAVNQARRQGIAVDTSQKCIYSRFVWNSKHKCFVSVFDDFCCVLSLRCFFFSPSSMCADGAGTNKQHVATKNTAKLDRENDELKHEKIPMEVGKIIQQGRNAKGLSQKDLATVSGVRTCAVCACVYVKRSGVNMDHLSYYEIVLSFDKNWRVCALKVTGEFFK